MKRHPVLQPISKEHRVILSFCLDLKKGIQNDKPIQKIEAYIRWFWKTFLTAHFLFEEKYIYSIDSIDEALKNRALAEHSILKSIILQSRFRTDEAKQFINILEKHIRFEERQVFEKLQNNTSEKLLLKIKENHKTNDFCIIPGAFWK